MQKIETQLADLASNNPGKIFDAIIVVRPRANIAALITGKYTHLMDEIISALLTGEQIIKLAEEKEVISIELNAAMSIS